MGHYELLMEGLIGAETAVALIAFHAYVVHSTPQVSDLLDQYFLDRLRNRHQLPRQLVQLLHARSRMSAPGTDSVPKIRNRL
jgi:hypothetical protein